MPDPSVLRAADLISQGRSAQAEPGLRARVRRAPADADAARLLGLALLNTGKADQALYFTARSMELAPSPAACDAHGTVLVVLGGLEEAERVFRAGISMDGGLPSLHNGLGGALLNQKKYDGAAEAFARAREIDPRSVVYLRQHAAALVRAHRTPEAMTLLREGAAAFPNDVLLRTQLVSSLNYEDADPAERLEHARALGALFARVAGPRPDFANAGDAARVLKVGLLSADWFDHPVAHFMSPLFERTPAGLSLHVYDASRKRDATTGKLRKLAAGWREVESLGDAAVAAQMRKDGIDVAVDLGGHTVDSRVAVMAFHPAPVCVSYLGYPATTGMAGVGWRAVDSLTDPPGSERWHTERLLRLDPCFLCFRPPDAAPDVAPLPAGAGSGVTFGSFNNPAKLSPRVLALWSRVLRDVQGSRLLLKGVGFDIPAVRDRLRAGAASAGIDPSRLEVLATTRTPAEHLATYARVDVALDTYPYHGTTTTCEALWMGVPVVTLEGAVHVSRVGVSLLHAAGCGDWIAKDEDAYVGIASELAAHPAGLARLRGGLRQRVAASSLADGGAFVARFEEALRHAWGDWCGMQRPGQA